MARLAYPRLEQISPSQRGAIVGVSSVATAVLIFLLQEGRPQMLLRTLDWLVIWSVLGMLFFSMCGRKRPAPGGKLTRALSDVTYPVYLAHLFFLGPLRGTYWTPSRSSSRGQGACCSRSHSSISAAHFSAPVRAPGSAPESRELAEESNGVPAPVRRIPPAKAAGLHPSALSTRA